MNEATNSLVLTPASSITPRRQRWACASEGHGIIPAGTATHCAGKGGEGKTTFVLSLFSDLAQGTLEGDYYGHPAGAMIVGPEHDWAPVMVPRLMAAEANLDRVFQVSIRTINEERTGCRTCARQWAHASHFPKSMTPR